MIKKWFIIFQLSMFFLLVLFMVPLVFPSWGVKIPTGTEGEWFTKLWEIYLVVANFAGLALLVKDADIGSNITTTQTQQSTRSTTGDKAELTKGATTNVQETVSLPGALDPTGLQ
jgi:hypothetical protein